MISHEIFNLICWIWIGIGVIMFFVLLKIPQPYGRHTKTDWGPMIDNRLGWLVMELPALLVFVYFVQLTTNWLNLLLLTAFALWVWHYFNRAIIFPFRLKTKGKKMPVVIMGSAIFFNLVNGTQSLPALAFLVWTLANLIPRALDHHKWYRQEFPDYPAKRKAVFPFLV